MWELQGLLGRLHRAEMGAGLSSFQFTHGWARRERRHCGQWRWRHEFPLWVRQIFHPLISYGQKKHMYDYQLHLYAVSRVACGAVWPQYLGLCSSAWGWWQAGARSHLDSEQSQWSLCSWLCWSSGLQARPRSAKAPSSAEISLAAVAQNIIICINLELNKTD